MTIVICIIMTALVLAGVVAAFVWGIDLGLQANDQLEGDERMQARLQALRAERRLHDITREAFVAMSERAEQRRQNRGEL